ncbi:nuclear transport factor 2 family protein [Herbiconiux sp. VKM Ac-1786]|uniref:nuclear transport factor 2 family protein n=1 Tax=Herbiconiux sp. VKM Ac-1786 TaxID=2783824 RepID=UPI00188D2F14|nr:nuclear transport factor 2 family protein [Herbiconiux sp. VKM Ac-1786]MBF4571861.1 nuclear transport factor 2 family protein [Herbiconiux sp. VKM Ac-1786]
MTTLSTLSTHDVFAAIDANKSAEFAELFTPTGRFTFANGDPMVGPEAIKGGVEYFYTTIKGLRHQVVQEWTVGHDTIVELSVSYDRHDGGNVTIPVTTIWSVDDEGRFEDYRIFGDLTPVYA